MLVNGDGTGGQAQGYMPWGETRYGGVGTEYQYTGQYRLAALGLDYYGARWYDPSLGRFAQADSIVPLASQGAQAWDRYAYANNNPVRYNDPSGHMVYSGCDIEGCAIEKIHQEASSSYNKPLEKIDRNEFKILLPPGPPLLPTPLPDNSLIPPPIIQVPASPINISQRTYITNQPVTIGPYVAPTGEPDYVIVNGTIGLPGSPIGSSISVMMDYYSNVYGSLGVNIGKSYSTGWSASVSAGWIGGGIVDSVRPSESDMEGFLSGLAINASGGVGPGTGLTWSPFATGSATIATEIGTYTPQIGITVSWAWMIFDNR